MAKVTIPATTFGNLRIGDQFISAGGSLWFKKSGKTAVGLTPHQGPLGRHWDYFKKSDPVSGASR
jgi:hypothetical protein